MFYSYDDNRTSARAHKIVNGTAYKKETSATVIKILEHSRIHKTRLVISYGDRSTGRIWEASRANRGHVGRLEGDVRVPVLLRTLTSNEGESILDNYIVQIMESRGGKVLYSLTDGSRVAMVGASSPMRLKLTR